jgi:hypothetical protein
MSSVVCTVVQAQLSSRIVQVCEVHVWNVHIYGMYTYVGKLYNLQKHTGYSINFCIIIIK